MILSEDFQFSQGSLSDYADCARRFQLRYVLEQEWPAIESEPLLERERLADLGRRFHRLIQQHVHGLPLEQLATAASADPDLARWWQNYLTWIDGETGRQLPTTRRAELKLTIPFGKHRLVAKFDLLAAGDGRAVIVDWKTQRKRSKREMLARRLQTRVYRYVLAKSDSSLAPESIAMMYWFAEHPSQPIVFEYDAAQLADDEEFLHGMLAEIERQREDVWQLTPNERMCRFCTYRSLCERGVVAGVDELDDVDFVEDVEIDLSEIDEIVY